MPKPELDRRTKKELREEVVHAVKKLAEAKEEIHQAKEAVNTVHFHLMNFIAQCDQRFIRLDAMWDVLSQTLEKEIGFKPEEFETKFQETFANYIENYKQQLLEYQKRREEASRQKQAALEVSQQEEASPVLSLVEETPTTNL